MKLPKYPSLVLFIVAMLCCKLGHAQLPHGFHVEIYGEGDPILFIPGALSGGETWNEIAAHFSTTHQTHILTMPGYAGVPAQNDAPYLVKWKEHILTYIDNQNIENVTLVGHSIGGVLSMWSAISQHPRIQSLVIVDAMPFFAATFNPEATTGFDKAGAKAYMDSFASLTNEQVLQNRKLVAHSMTKNESKIDLLITWGMQSDLKTEAYTVFEMMGTDLRKDLQSVEIPVLVIAAYEENPHFPKSVLTEIYKEQYKYLRNYRLEIAENSRHFVMFDQPEWLTNHIRGFLKSSVAVK